MAAAARPNALTGPLRWALLGMNRLAGRVNSLGVTKKLLYDARNREIFTDVNWHERMLVDAVRVNAYRQGIARCMKPGDVVIDLGTGTGILAAMAAKSGAAKVYALDHSDFIDVARDIAARNGITNIEFVKTNSRQFSLTQRVDVVLHEQMDRSLFGENMIENLLDLKHRLLKPGGIIVPGRFEFFAEPAMLKNEHRVPYLWEIDDVGLDLGFLRDSSLLDPYKTPSYPFVYLSSCFVDRLLCEPQPLLRFDLNEMRSADDIPRKFAITRTVQHDGRLDGLCIHFRAAFDAQTILDTSPLQPETHWGNLLFRTERRQCRAGDRISYTVELPELLDRKTWKIAVSTVSPAATPD